MFKGLSECFSKYSGYFVVFGGFLVHLSLGSFYTYGNIQPYVVEYMQNRSYSGKDVTMGNSVWIFGLMVFGMGAAVSVGEYFNERIGPLLTVLISGWFYCANVCLTYFTIKSYLFVIAISDGLFAGFGMGIAYGVALTTPCKWFPNHKGLVMGTIVAGFGLSATIFDYLQIYYINNQMDNHIIITERLPQSYYILGFSYMALIGIGSMFLKNPPTSEHLNENSDDNMSPRILLGIQSKTEERATLKPHQLFFEFDFWILWITFALNAACVVLLMSLYKAFGFMLGLSDKFPYHYLTVASILGALFNCIGRIFWGVFNDKMSYKSTMLTLTLSTTILYPTFYICSVIGDLKKEDETSRLIMFTVWIILLNFIISGNFTIFPTICANLFGIKHIVANYGILFTSASFGGTVISIITTTLWHNKPDQIQLYLHSFIAGGVMSLVAAGLTLLYRGRSLMQSCQ